MKTHGYECSSASSGEEGLVKVETYNPDLILLDIMLPGIDGIEVCRRLKNDTLTRKIPVLMLSALSQNPDKITGFEGGADDYITKPFSIQELFLRIKAALRQVDILSTANKTMFKKGSLTLDAEKYLVRSGGKKIDLTLTEFRILHAIIKNFGTVISRKVLIREIMDKPASEGGRIMDVHIRNIRKKLSENFVTGCNLETVRGVGYIIK